jgi:hypothetical protein
MISAKSDVQVDTAEVRVTEWRLAPGSATGHHIHEMDYVIVPVTSGEMTIVAPNGERSTAQLGMGKSSRWKRSNGPFATDPSRLIPQCASKFPHQRARGEAGNAEIRLEVRSRHITVGGRDHHRRLHR